MSVPVHRLLLLNRTPKVILLILLILLIILLSHRIVVDKLGGVNARVRADHFPIEHFFHSSMVISLLLMPIDLVE